MKITPTHLRKLILLDQEDQHLFDKYKFYVHKSGYVMAYAGGGRLRQSNIKLHRLVMNAAFDVVVHHINENKLDNRKENLQIMTDSVHQSKHKTLWHQQQRSK